MGLIINYLLAAPPLFCQPSLLWFIFMFVFIFPSVLVGVCVFPGAPAFALSLSPYPFSHAALVSPRRESFWRGGTEKGEKGDGDSRKQPKKKKPTHSHSSRWKRNL